MQFLTAESIFDTLDIVERNIEKNKKTRDTKPSQEALGSAQRVLNTLKDQLKKILTGENRGIEKQQAERILSRIEIIKERTDILLGIELTPVSKKPINIQSPKLPEKDDIPVSDIPLRKRNPSFKRKKEESVPPVSEQATEPTEKTPTQEKTVGTISTPPNGLAGNNRTPRRYVVNQTPPPQKAPRKNPVEQPSPKKSLSPVAKKIPTQVTTVISHTGQNPIRDQSPDYEMIIDTELQRRIIEVVESELGNFVSYETLAEKLQVPNDTALHQQIIHVRNSYSSQRGMDFRFVKDNFVILIDIEKSIETSQNKKTASLSFGDLQKTLFYIPEIRSIIAGNMIFLGPEYIPEIFEVNEKGILGYCGQGKKVKPFDIFRRNSDRVGISDYIKFALGGKTIRTNRGQNPVKFS